VKGKLMKVTTALTTFDCSGDDDDDDDDGLGL